MSSYSAPSQFMYRKKVENQLIVDNKEGVSVTSKTSPVSSAVLTMGSCVWVRIVKDLFLMAGRNLGQDGRVGGTPETMVRIRLCQDRKR